MKKEIKPNFEKLATINNPKSVIIKNVETGETNLKHQIYWAISINGSILGW